MQVLSCWLGMSKRSKSLVNAFSLVPVVEQILPDRQKIEVTLLILSIILILVLIGGMSVCVGTLPVCRDAVWTSGLLFLRGT